MPNDVKRLPPTPTTLRQLYLRSGNLCAHPGCTTVLINREGTMVGDICHICAAEVNGPRFDATMTNETRRAPANLILMCAVHHRKVDREFRVYTAQRLAQMKADHEARFSEIENTLTRRFEQQFEDQTDAIVATQPETFAAFNATIESGLHEPEYVATAREQIAAYAARLKLLPQEDRKLMAAVIKRAIKVGLGPYFGGPSVVVHFDEFAAVHTVSKPRTYRLTQALERHQLGGFHEHFGDHQIRLADPSEYILWSEIAEFCEARDISIDRFVVDVQFGFLD